MSEDYENQEIGWMLLKYIETDEKAISFYQRNGCEIIGFDRYAY